MRFSIPLHQSILVSRNCTGKRELCIEHSYTAEDENGACRSRACLTLPCQAELSQLWPYPLTNLVRGWNSSQLPGTDHAGSETLSTKKIKLDARDWKVADDVYESFLTAVGAPRWHGRNLDALNDSIANGCINSVEIPYTIVIKHVDKMGQEAFVMTRKFVELIMDLNERDEMPVWIQFEVGEEGHQTDVEKKMTS